MSGIPIESRRMGKREREIAGHDREAMVIKSEDWARLDANQVLYARERFWYSRAPLYHPEIFCSEASEL